MRKVTARQHVAQPMNNLGIAMKVGKRHGSQAYMRMWLGQLLLRDQSRVNALAQHKRRAYCAHHRGFRESPNRWRIW